MRIKILVIDDEESICEILKYNLEKEGYEVDTALSAEEALEMDLPSYSLFIVDIMMDQLSGFDFAKRLKNDDDVENTPIIFCSALSGEDDTVMGLNIGADDYITKPFKIPEVLARVRSVLRRSHVTRDIAQTRREGKYESDVVFKGLRLSRNQKECHIDGQLLPLSRTEFDLLLYFLTHRNRIYSREDIINEVWDKNVVVTNRTVDTNLTRLRKKLGAYGKHIETRVGFGYGFTETA
ncbi:MAG: response regulator transcription factor [Muribaculaceae bacterium]|nr:response regulator transcription factor [Muribaculaceae bacterium]